MNFINCTLQIEGDQAWLMQKAGGQRTPIDDKRRRLLEGSAHAEQLILGIRPEHMALAPNQTAASVWEGTVFAIEPLGPKTVVHLRVGEDLVQIIGPASYRPRPGERQYVELDLARTHVFDGKSRAVIR